MKVLTDTDTLVWALTGQPPGNRGSALAGSHFTAGAANLWELVSKSHKAGALLADPLPGGRSRRAAHSHLGHSDPAISASWRAYPSCTRIPSPASSWPRHSPRDSPRDQRCDACALQCASRVGMKNYADEGKSPPDPTVTGPQWEPNKTGLKMVTKVFRKVGCVKYCLIRYCHIRIWVELCWRNALASDSAMPALSSDTRDYADLLRIPTIKRYLFILYSQDGLA